MVEKRLSKNLVNQLLQIRDVIIDNWYANQFSADVLKDHGSEYALNANRESVIIGYLKPLYALLVGYARTGDSTYRHMYQSERRRYAPHRKGNQALAAYFKVVLPIDESAILERVGSETRNTIAEWLSELHQPLIETGDSGRRNCCILTIGDCLMGSIQSLLLSSGQQANLDFDFRYYYFSASQGANIDQDGISDAIRNAGIDYIAASYLSYEGIPLYRSVMGSAGRISDDSMHATISGIDSFIRSHLTQIRAITSVPILLHNASGLPLTRWRSRLPIPALSKARKKVLSELNAVILDISRDTENCILVDEVSIGRQFGLRKASKKIFSSKEFRNATFHPIEFERQVAKEYLKVLLDLTALKKIKVLLLDFDNTLWKGVMADEAVIQYHDRQQLLKQLSEQGILLAAVSKNDEKNIRWNEMLLTQDDFVSMRINWNLKAQSIQEIAAELNLGLDSFVLIDDNPAEREMVTREIPSMLALDADKTETWESIARLFQMPNTQETEEAKTRKQMYQQQTKRKSSFDGKSDYPALMQALELKADIRAARRADIERIVELSQRTNQFNTTTIRYQRSEIESMLTDANSKIIVADLADKFGALGLVCVAVMRVNSSSATIESFVMSCRAMGFALEKAVLALISAEFHDKQIIGLFRPSPKNEPASALFPSAGFKKNEGDEWLLSMNSLIPFPEWITSNAKAICEAKAASDSAATSLAS